LSAIGGIVSTPTDVIACAEKQSHNWPLIFTEYQEGKNLRKPVALGFLIQNGLRISP